MMSQKKKNLWKVLKRGLGVLLILTGLCFYLYPVVSSVALERKTSKAIQKFQECFGTQEMEEAFSEFPETAEEETVYPVKKTGGTATEEEKTALYQACFAYNCRIYAAAQSGLKDVESYEAVDLGDEVMEILPDGLFGYIEIPAMDVTLPLYLGASTENMAAGAAVLGETSLPIGGLNTNAVISGHRGYRGSPYFREIEKLTVGDVVYITNPWETLTYEVTEIDIISPSDAGAVKIQEGRDMITLITCHPYRSGGKYRYVVYCDRADPEDTEVCAMNTDDKKEGADDVALETAAAAENPDPAQTDLTAKENNDSSTDAGAEYIVASDGTVYESSERDIRTEQMLWFGSGIFLTVLLFIQLLILRKPMRTGNRGEQGTGENREPGRTGNRGEQETGENRKPGRIRNSGEYALGKKTERVRGIF